MKNITILLVEDEAIQKLHLANSLKRLYKNVIDVENGKLAKDIIENNSQIDILITDINMPRINGFGSGADLIDYVIENKQTNAIPIVVTTAHKEFICHYKDYECMAVISKPFNLNNLINKIDELMALKNIDRCTKKAIDKLHNVNSKVNMIIELMKKGEKID